MEHLLFSCSFVFEVWSFISELNFDSVRDVPSVVKWSNEKIFLDSNLLQLVICVSWFVWKARNRLIFEADFISLKRVAGWFHWFPSDLHISK